MEMESSESLNPEALRSKIEELANFLVSPSDISHSDSEKLLHDTLLSFEAKVDQIVGDHSDITHFTDEGLDSYLDRLKAELKVTEAENASLSKEIETLENSYVEGSCKLESNLESLRHVVDYASTEAGEAKAAQHVDRFEEMKGYQKLGGGLHDDSLEILKLQHQVDMNKKTLKSLEDLDLKWKRIDAIEKIKEALTGFKVLDVEGNIIRVSLKTFIPDVEALMSQLKDKASTNHFEVNHELLIEVMDGTMVPKNVEMFPNDVYIGEIVEAANAFSNLFVGLPVQGTRCTLGWFLQKVQDRIVMCNLRRLMVKAANNSRHSFEYLDKDDTIVAHMAVHMDAFLKPSQGWPLSSSVLKLVSLRSSDEKANQISLSFLSKVEEKANCLDINTRKSITSFVNGIEEILLEQMRP